MKKYLLIGFSIAVIGLLFSGILFAQDERVVSAAGDTYLISAKAGGINYVEGKVAVARVDGKSGYLLKNDKLEIGDKVSTGADAKVEILLNPGSYVRLGANSSFEFVTTNLDDLQLKLSSGSAVFEVYADDEFRVSINLPNADIQLTKSGVYRVDVRGDGSGKISVWKGKVYVGSNLAEVKTGRSAIVVGKQAIVSKFDRDNKDELDTWSDLRAKEAARINARLQRDQLRNALLGSYNQGAWGLFNSFGVWVFDSFTGRWCFLPFGRGWGSPYGYDYGFNLWDCRLPYYVYNPPPPPPPSGGGTPTTPNNDARLLRAQTPPFLRIDNGAGVPRNGGFPGNGGGSSSSDQSSSSSSSSETTKSNSSSSSSETTKSSSSSSNDTKTTYDTKPTYSPPPPPTTSDSPTKKP